MDTLLIGREAELGHVDELLESVDEGAAGLLLEGEAGIGKTTVWNAGLEATRRGGLRLLVCRGARAEAKLGYAALTDCSPTSTSRRSPSCPAPSDRR